MTHRVTELDMSDDLAQYSIQLKDKVTIAGTLCAYLDSTVYLQTVPKLDTKWKIINFFGMNTKHFLPSFSLIQVISEADLQKIQLVP